MDSTIGRGISNGTVNIDGHTLTDITKLSYMYVPPFKSANTIKISIKDNKILCRLIDKVGNRCENLTHVEITTEDRMAWEPEPFSSVPLTIDCDFAVKTSAASIQSITVRNVDYGASRRTPRHLFERIQLPKQRKPVSYLALTSLIIDGCRFDSDHAFLPESAVLVKDGYSESKMKRKGYPCPLDLALHGAKNLVSLKILCRSAPTIDYEPWVSPECISLQKLKSAVLPSPALRSFDIDMPGLQHLAYAFANKDELREHEAQGPSSTPLIALPGDTVLMPATIYKLKSFEVMACSSDKVSILLEWLYEMPHLKRLAVTCAPRRAVSSRDIYPEERLKVFLLDGLIKYAFSPCLEELHLDGVAASSAKLIEHIDKPRAADTPLRTLKVTGPTRGANACAAVHEMIDFQHIRDHSTVALDMGDGGCRCPCVCPSG